MIVMQSAKKRSLDNALVHVLTDKIYCIFFTMGSLILSG